MGHSVHLYAVNTNGDVDGRRKTDIELATDVERVERFFRYCQQKTFQPLRTCQQSSKFITSYRYNHALANPGFSFGGQIESRRHEYRGATGAESVGFREGCPLPMGEGSGEWAVPLPRKVLDFFALEWCILRAF